MTDVPYGRGGSPLQNLIVRGHTETKLTALRCVRDLDADGYPPAFLETEHLRLEFSKGSLSNGNSDHPQELTAEVRIRLKESS